MKLDAVGPEILEFEIKKLLPRSGFFPRPTGGGDCSDSAEVAIALHEVCSGTVGLEAILVGEAVVVCVVLKAVKLKDETTFAAVTAVALVAFLPRKAVIVGEAGSEGHDEVHPSPLKEAR